MTEWGSFIDIHGNGYGIGPLPERKRIAVYHRTRNTFSPIAYFTREEDARAFMVWLEKHVRQEADDG